MPETPGAQATEMYLPTLLEAVSLRSKRQQGWFPSEPSLLGLQMVTPSLCPHMAFTQRVSVSQFPLKRIPVILD